MTGDDNDAMPSGLPMAMLEAAQQTMPQLPAMGLSLLDEASFRRALELAQYMSEANGLPGFFARSPGTCLAAIELGLRLRISPFAVAANAYQPKPGQPLAFMGKFVAAAINTSGYLEGNLEYEHYGPWENIDGRFVLVEGGKEREDGTKSKYPRASYTFDDEKGLGVICRGRLRRTGAVKEYDLKLIQCYPRNSPLWAANPWMQITYTAARKWADLHAPEILLGISSGDDMVDITDYSNQRERTDHAAVADKPKAGTGKRDGNSKVDAFLHQHGKVAQETEANPAQDVADGPIRVTLLYPDRKGSKSLTLAEASIELLKLANECAGRAGLEWIEQAVRLNPWAMAHGPTRNVLENIREKIAAAA